MLKKRWRGRAIVYPVPFFLYLLMGNPHAAQRSLLPFKQEKKRHSRVDASHAMSEPKEAFYDVVNPLHSEL